MPRVPQVNTIPDQTPFQTGRGADADAFGVNTAQALGNVGQGAASLGSDLTDIQIAENNAEADRNFNEGRLEYDQRVKQLLYGDGTEENRGFFSLSQKDAMEQAPVLDEEIRGIRSEIQGRYTGQARRRLDVSLQEKEITNTTQMAEFTAREAKAYDQTLRDGRKGEYIDDAARGFRADGEIDKALSGARVIVSQDADANGWAPEVTVSQMEAADTAIIQQAFNSAIKEGELDRAQEILDNYGSRVDGPILSEMRAVQTDQKQLAKMFTEVDRIAALTSNPQERMAEARKIKDPALRQLVEDEMGTRNRQEAEAVRQAKAAAETESQTLANSGWTEAQLRQDRPDLYNVLAGDAQALKNFRATVQAQAENRLYSQTGDETLFNQLMAVQENEFRKLTLEQMEGFRARLSKEQYGKVSSVWTKANSSVQNDLENTERFNNANRTLKSMLPAGFQENLADKDSEEVGRFQVLQNEMTAWMTNYQETNKKWPSQQEITDRAMSLVTPIEKTGRFFGLFSDEQFAGELTNVPREERENFFVDQGDLSPLGKAEFNRLFREHNLEDLSSSQKQAFVNEMTWAEIDSDPIEQQRIMDKYQRILGNVRAPEVAPPVNPSTPSPEEAPLELGRDKLTSFVTANEGLRLASYDDSEGIRTVGVGFNLERSNAREAIEKLGLDFDQVFSGEQKLTRSQAKLLLQEDINQAIVDARSIVPSFEGLTPARQTALIDMSFNLGLPRLSKFRKMLAAIEAGDFDKAADEAKDSVWFKQVGRRGPKIVRMIREG